MLQEFMISAYLIDWGLDSEMESRLKGHKATISFYYTLPAVFSPIKHSRQWTLIVRGNVFNPETFLNILI